MNFKFANLLGSPYRGGNLLVAGSDLLSIGGNRILQVAIAAIPDMFILHTRSNTNKTCRNGTG